MSAPKIVVVTGPTASGKTALGAALAKAFGGEVVSADSMQIYKGMDIGTAKPRPEETLGVPHRMIGVVSPFEDYSVARYVADAGAWADDILARGKTPFLVGGTGLYIDSLLSGRTFAPRDGDGAARARYSALYDERGGEAMLRLLAERDPARAARLHPNDKKRVVRALEASELGEELTAHDAKTRELPPRYGAAVIVLNFRDRAQLYARIDARADAMMAQGLADEVRGLLDAGLSRERTAMQAIGYKEIAAALCGECSMEEAADAVKLRSRRYAKRQISWCSRYRDALRVDWDARPDFAEALRLSTAFVSAAGIR